MFELLFWRIDILVSVEVIYYIAVIRFQLLGW